MMNWKLVPFLSCLGLFLHAQTLAEWDFENIVNRPNLPIPASTTHPDVSSAFADLSGGSNTGSPDACSGNETWATNFWPTTTSRSPVEYLEFSFSATADLHIYEFEFASNVSSANSAGQFDVYFSTDGFLTENFLFSGSSGLSCSRNLEIVDLPVSSGTTVRFRIYPYGQSPGAQAATLRIDNVIIHGSTLLPVELSRFAGHSTAKGVILEWHTESETNSDRFEIDRQSADGQWLPVGELPAAGESQNIRYYTFTDPSPGAGYNYYRLRQIDRDGSVSTSPVITVPYHFQKEVIAGPQPFSDRIWIRGLPLHQSANWTLTDALGRPLQEGDLEAGLPESNIITEDYPGGYYVLIIRVGGQIICQKLIKGG